MNVSAYINVASDFSGWLRGIGLGDVPYECIGKSVCDRAQGSKLRLLQPLG